MHTGVVIVVRPKIDDNSGDLARARETIIVFISFFSFGAVTDSSPLPLLISSATPLHSFTRCEAKHPLGLGLSHRIEDFETMLTGGGRGGRHWALLSFSPLTDRDVSIISIGSAWLIQLNVDCFIERL